MNVTGLSGRSMAPPWPSPSVAATAAQPREAPPAFAAVEATEPIAVGTTDVPRGSIGITFCISHDEIEVDFYEPRHVVAFADASQLQVK